MKLTIFLAFSLATPVPFSRVLAQTAAQVTPPTSILCVEGSTCTHVYIEGSKYKTITTEQLIVTVDIRGGAKYARASVNVVNKSSLPIDVLPADFTIKEVAPKEKVFAYLPPAKILKSDAHRAGWANALNAFGAGMATQQVTTQTSSSGTVSATSTNGTYANGTYSGTSTSTTSVPNYAAQAQAQENIRRRREALTAESQRLATTTLSSNSVMPEHVVSGYVYFSFDKKARDIMLNLPIGGVVYQFPFTLQNR